VPEKLGPGRQIDSEDNPKRRQPTIRAFSRVHVMLSILGGPGGGAAGVWGRQPRRHDPTGRSGRELQPQRRAAARFRCSAPYVAPRCACTVQQHCRGCNEGRGCDQNDLPAGHAADDHSVDHDWSGVASAAWFRRRQSGESGVRGCAERQDGAGQRGQDGGETVMRRG
jgi:hypothetical protein